MKKRIWIPAVLLAVAVCAGIWLKSALPEREADVPEKQDDLAPMTGVLGTLDANGRINAVQERLRSLKAEELEEIDGRFARYSSAEVVSWIQSAAEHKIERTEDLEFTFWDLRVYLPQNNPEKDVGLTQEIISISASPREENILEVSYRSLDRINVTYYVENSQLYWFVRNAYSTQDVIDEEAMAPYRDLLEAEAQECVDISQNWYGAQPLSGFEIISFQQKHSFQQSGADYAIYDWDAAFFSEDPAMAGWAGGMWLDHQCRIRRLVKNTVLLVRTADGETDCILVAPNDWRVNDQAVVDVFVRREQEGTVIKVG